MLKAYSVQQLNAVSKKKEIWCFGCGKRLSEIFNLYEGEPFVARISMILDNNHSLWGKRKRIGKKEIVINSPDAISRGKNKHVLIVITSDHYKEIFDGIFPAVRKSGIDCSRYPVCYYSYSKALMAACKLLPIKRQMLFYAGDQPHENAKAIAEYLTTSYRGNNHYRLVFLSDNRDINNPDIVFIGKNTLKCKSRFSSNLKYCFYTAVSKYIFYENEPLEKTRDRQILVYLNHGTIPLKKVSDVLRQPEQMDYGLCPSERCAYIYEQQYNIPRTKQIYGMPPRDDFLKKADKLDKVIDRKGRQVIIWLPTFRSLKGSGRKDSSVEDALSLIAAEEDLAELDRHLQDNNQILLIKNHPEELRKLNIPVSLNGIKILTEEDLKKADVVLQEILGGTAALITDYSGISFEYLLLNRPIGYVVNDMTDYTRGFAFKNIEDYMPGPMIHTGKELKEFFNDIMEGKDRFQEQRKNLMDKLFQKNDLKSGSRELIKQLEERKNTEGQDNGYSGISLRRIKKI